MTKEELKQELSRIIGTFAMIKDNYEGCDMMSDERMEWCKAWDETTIVLRKLLVNSYGCDELPEISHELSIIWNNSRCSGKDMVILSLNLLLKSIS